MGKKTIEKVNPANVWESTAKIYEYIEGAYMSNSFIILMALSKSKEPLSTTKISEKIAINSRASYSKFLERSKIR